MSVFLVRDPKLWSLTRNTQKCGAYNPKDLNPTLTLRKKDIKLLSMCEPYDKSLLRF